MKWFFNLVPLAVSLAKVPQAGVAAVEEIFTRPHISLCRFTMVLVWWRRLWDPRHELVRNRENITSKLQVLDDAEVA
jgi:hypothetical protein